MEPREVHHRVGANEELEKRVFRAGFSDIAQWRARLAQAELAVCRIEAPAWQALGTGFLVGPDLVMTNRHVIDAFSARRRPPILARFDFKLSGDGERLREGEAFGLAPEWLVASSPVDELDFAILRLAQPAGLRPTTSSASDVARGWITPRWRPLEPDETVFVIQHPQGETLKLAAGRYEAREPTRLRYRVDTEPGSSGAPCFTAQMELIALHRGAADGHANQGVPIDAVQAALPADFFPAPSAPLPSADAATGTWPAVLDAERSGTEARSDAAQGSGSAARSGSESRRYRGRLAVGAAGAAVVVALVAVPLWWSRDDTTEPATVPPKTSPAGPETTRALPPVVRKTVVDHDAELLPPTQDCVSRDGVERARYRLTTKGTWPAQGGTRAHDVQVEAIGDITFESATMSMSGGVSAVAVSIPHRDIARKFTFAERVVPPVVIVTCVRATPPHQPVPALQVNTWREVAQ
ncbi:MAG: trypsin-like peptidase domain-containing protein [Acidobacteria bacterium]|nr:trypsin-like peptidase domain-containing protein [Acidobacteriota bacterium]